MDYRRDRVRFLQAPTGEVRVVVDHGQPYGRLVAVVPPDDDDNPTEAST
jgi:hypothetical protein